ncbi:hypothetical protein Fcan01_21106 [Folsomia candida]|uniref:Uncharacterized protein n=1 Tax=Folsomia candida TaxID=158441 RepID=A0A226DIE1_FOLCA|nr:hypothetical protein Fcan01_21106 [Folsomia candida]
MISLTVPPTKPPLTYTHFPDVQKSPNLQCDWSEQSRDHPRRGCGSPTAIETIKTTNNTTSKMTTCCCGAAMSNTNETHTTSCSFGKTKPSRGSPLFVLFVAITTAAATTATTETIIPGQEVTGLARGVVISSMMMTKLLRFHHLPDFEDFLHRDDNGRRRGQNEAQTQISLSDLISPSILRKKPV